jgi:S-adenosylmethionine:tRNA ribosyltransferase-isomerase
MHPKHLSINDFTYNLPDDKIARHPLAKRDDSKLLVYRDGEITTSQYHALDTILPPETLLVFNNTKVVEARLIFKKSTGGTIELFCLEPHDQYPDITTAMLQKQTVLWKCLVGGAKKWKEGPVMIEIEQKPLMGGATGKTLLLTAEKIEKQGDYFIIKFSWSDSNLAFAEVLHKAGQIPLPPYLNREVEEKDKDSYQTVYARHDGSVAAPTAGLHFTEALLARLAARNIQTAFVTLHVGAGTFKPVKAATMEQHDMHSEFIDVTAAFIQQLLQNQGRTIITVGTTSMRTVESLYWMGVKTTQLLQTTAAGNITEEHISIKQWDAYELPQHIPVQTALANLLQWMEATGRQRLITKTQIIIAPGYTLKVAGGLITNFHQPQSTLLLLVAAVIGDDWRKVYNYALQNNFRFLSYGDGSLLMKAVK